MKLATVLLVSIGTLGQAGQAARLPTPKAGPSSILGVEMGAPLDVKACSETQGKPCTFADKPTLDGSFDVFVDTPSGFQGGMSVWTSDGTQQGRVVKVEIKTYGVESQGDALRALARKYGAPIKVAKSKQQTMMGVRFEEVDAAWLFTNVIVQFTGAYRVDEGSVTIETVDQFDKEQDQRKQEAGRKL